MELFGGLITIGKKKTDAPAPVQKTVSYGEIFGHGISMDKFFNQVIKPYESIATVYKAVKALCDNVPQAKLNIYNKATDEETDDPTLRALIENPNPTQSQSDFIQEWVGYYALYGEGFIKMVLSLGQVAGIARGLPAQLYNLDPSKIKEVLDSYMLKEWRYGTTIYQLQELIHTKDFNPYNRYRGMSPLKPIADEMEIDQASLTFNSAFFKNNANAGLILSTDDQLGKDQREALIKTLKAKYSGGENAFKTLILEKGLKPQDTGHSSHKEMEFIEQKRLMREEILGIWRTPKALFNITDDLNYATFMGQMRVFWLYGLMPIMRKLEDSLNKNIVTPYNANLRIGFDYKNTPAFQEDFKERAVTAEILNRIGFTGNEINEKLELGFEDKTWRDDWWINFSLVPAKDAGTIREDQQQANADRLQAIADQNNNNNNNGQEPNAGKSLAMNVRKSNFIKMFLKGQGNIERLMESKISRYFMELRTKVLKLSVEDLKHHTLNIDWQAENERLVKLIKPVMLEGIKTGVAIGEQVLGRKKHLDDQSFEHRVNSLLQIRMDKLTGINNTIKNRLTNTLATTLNEQIQAGASATQQVEALREAVRSFFNLSASRALLIARTESGGAVNGGSMLYYQNEGVQAKEWVTAHDELVRESHREAEAQGAIPMANSFANGLMYPQDQSSGEPAEVCNCRCSLLPVVE
jgi:HK97 family phage portal protein